MTSKVVIRIFQTKHYGFQIRLQKNIYIYILITRIISVNVFE